MTSQIQAKPSPVLFEKFSLSSPGNAKWSLTSSAQHSFSVNALPPASYFTIRYRDGVNGGVWTAPGNITPVGTQFDVTDTPLRYDVQIRWVSATGFPLSDWSATKSINT